MSEKLHFKVSSGLKDIIGRDLITNELVAIFELVKNSYDADATEINIVINSYDNSIIIQDNGKGMDRYDIENKWLFVAHSEKKDSERVYAGSKGIGRFSCDRLGSKLTLLSKKNNELSELTIDWGEFEKNSLDEFEKMEVTYRSNSEVSNLFELESGTVLKITELRDTWSKERVEKVFSALQRLVNPFVDDGKIKINIKYFSSASQIAEIDREVSNNIATVLDKKTIYLECTVKEKEISVTLFDKEKTIYSFYVENTTILKNIYFKIYYLSTAAKNNFTRIMGTEAKNYGSIFLYKNNFRIFPYGEPDYDSFGLNLRKTQGYNRHLGHRELLGWINITDSENHFKEVTSRDRGFVTNTYTIAFEDLYMEFIQRPLESYVQLVKFGNSEIDDIQTDDGKVIEKLTNRFKKYKFTTNPKYYELPKIAQPLDKKFDLLADETISASDKKEIQKNLKQTAMELTRENKAVKKEKEQVTQENERLKNKIAIADKFIDSSKPARQDMLFHELGKVASEINGTLKKMMRLMDEVEFEKFSDTIYKLRRTSDKLSSIKKQILRINFETYSKTEKIEIKTYLKSYIENTVNDTSKIKINIGSGVIEQKINIYDFGTLIDNLIINAQDRDASNINFYFEDDNSALHVVSDTGPIKIRPIEDIFRLGVTSKHRGTGLGMYISKQICQDFGWKITVSESTNNYVDFKIEFSKES
ncbi:ATP-binding protein [Streptococcus ovuberis]|uniref:Histidine kinase n=1 Tax=Streptococcus ovuberis TaxID=1936207 RepID=A0A7X6S0T7_9STRE|nr:ATP-binding protein [Streptococcus ovuberis]NKZ19670.1 histidine kinase [Streptococcus ovuberis]